MTETLPPEPASSASPAADTGQGRSLAEDVLHLLDDGRTYLEAELQFQKSRAVVGAKGTGKAAAFAMLGFAFLLLALLAITVGLLLALAPWLGVWGAMAAVTVALLGGAAGCGLYARRIWRATMAQARGPNLERGQNDA